MLALLFGWFDVLPSFNPVWVRSSGKSLTTRIHTSTHRSSVCGCTALGFRTESGNSAAGLRFQRYIVISRLCIAHTTQILQRFPPAKAESSVPAPATHKTATSLRQSDTLEKTREPGRHKTSRRRPPLPANSPRFPEVTSYLLRTCVFRRSREEHLQQQQQGYLARRRAAIYACSENENATGSRQLAGELVVGCCFAMCGLCVDWTVALQNHLESTSCLCT